MYRLAPTRGWLVPAILCASMADTVAAQRLPTARDLDSACRAAEKLLAEGRYPEAIAAFRTALDMARRIPGAQRTNIARVSASLALAYTRDQQYDQAEPLFREALATLLQELRAGRGGVSPGDLGLIYNAQSVYFDGLNQLEAARSAASNAREFFRSGGLRDAENEAHFNVAVIDNRMGQHDQAMAALKEVLQYRKGRFGTDSVTYWNAATAIAEVHYNNRRYSESEKIYREYLSISEKMLGRDVDPEPLLKLAYPVHQLGRFDEADELLSRALRILEASFAAGSNQPSMRCRRLGVVKAYRGAWPQALQLADRGFRAEHAHYLRVAAGASESEQLTSLKDLRDGLSDVLSIGLARRTDPEAVALSAEWLINGKNQLFEVMAERALLMRDGRLAGKPELAAKLRTVRRQLSEMFGSEVPENSDRQREFAGRLAGLLESEASLSREIAAAAGQSRSARKWFSLPEIRRAIPAGQVLIEFCRVDAIDFSHKGGAGGLKREDRFAAWVLPAPEEGEPALIDLGPAGAVDGDIRRLLANLTEVERVRSEALKTVTDFAARNPGEAEFKAMVEDLKRKVWAEEAALETAFRKTATELSAKVMHPLLPHIGRSSRWILSPDGELWHVPWSALTLPDGRYVLDVAAIREIVTGRDLFAPQAPAAKSPPLVVANPNYSLGVVHGHRRGSQVPLPQFEELARKVLPMIEKIGKAPPLVLTGDNATEERFKSAASPRLLFLATHGEFSAADPGNPLPGPLNNPLLRCVLTFAGCDRVRAAGDNRDDGLLTGIEILGCNLRGTELVVLAACKSAVGDVHAGQAAVGLRSAFLLAGARSVEATLWSVDVVATAALSLKLFELLADDWPVDLALVESQRAVRDLWRKERGAAHPFYWAAYTVTVRGN